LTLLQGPLRMKIYNIKLRY